MKKIKDKNQIDKKSVGDEKVDGSILQNEIRTSIIGCLLKRKVSEWILEEEIGCQKSKEGMV